MSTLPRLLYSSLNEFLEATRNSPYPYFVLISMKKEDVTLLLPAKKGSGLPKKVAGYRHNFISRITTLTEVPAGDSKIIAIADWSMKVSLGDTASPFTTIPEELKERVSAQRLIFNSMINEIRDKRHVSIIQGVVEDYTPSDYIGVFDYDITDIVARLKAEDELAKQQAAKIQEGPPIPTTGFAQVLDNVPPESVPQETKIEDTKTDEPAKTDSPS